MLRLCMVECIMADTRSPPISFEASDADLARLLARVAEGAEILLMQHGVPVARISPIHAASPTRVFGGLRGQANVPDSFFDPLPDADLAAWDGR